MIRRGEVWVGNLNPARGKEVGKVRPGLQRFRVPLSARDRLLVDSYVVIDKPRALDPARLGEGPLTSLTAEEMAAVELSLRGVLGML